MRRYANEFDLPVEAVTKAPGDVFYFVNGFHRDEAEVVDEFRAFVPAMRADLRRVGTPTAESFTEDERELDLTSLAEYLDTRGAGPLIRSVTTRPTPRTTAARSTSSAASISSCSFTVTVARSSVPSATSTTSGST
jgi:hypothetical protein